MSEIKKGDLVRLKGDPKSLWLVDCLYGAAADVSLVPEGNHSNVSMHSILPVTEGPDVVPFEFGERLVYEGKDYKFINGNIAVDYVASPEFGCGVQTFNKGLLRRPHAKRKVMLQLYVSLGGSLLAKPAGEDAPLLGRLLGVPFEIEVPA